MATVTEPFRAPLGIALGVLAITLLIAFGVKRSSRRRLPESASAEGGAGGHRIVLGKIRGRRSVASELALLSELHAKGALSDEEFNAAKLRTLGD
ncbi:MAG: SHOCT domain-containing protein [Pseudarthrobacter sp.]